MRVLETERAGGLLTAREDGKIGIGSKVIIITGEELRKRQDISSTKDADATNSIEGASEPSDKPVSVDPTSISSSSEAIISTPSVVSSEISSAPLEIGSATVSPSLEASAPTLVEPTQVTPPPGESSTPPQAPSDASIPPHVSSASVDESSPPLTSLPTTIPTPAATTAAGVPNTQPTNPASVNSQAQPQAAASSVSSQPTTQAETTPIVNSALPTSTGDAIKSDASISTTSSKAKSNSSKSLLATIPASLTSTTPSALAIAESEASGAQSTLVTATRGGSDGDVSGTSDSGVSPSGTNTSSANGSLNVTKTSNGTPTSTIIAVSVSVIIGTLALSVLAYFLIRRYLRNRRLHGSARAESPPQSPLLDKFDPQRMLNSPLPLPAKSRPSSEISQGVWNSQTGMVEWGAQGQEKLGSERNGLSRYGNMGPALASPLSKLPSRDTLRVFPNGREKLGGKALPKDF